MSLPKGITQEQIKISCRNHYRACLYFWPDLKGRTPKGWCLHHIDETLRLTNLERYIEWRIEDVEPREMRRHTSEHMKGRNNYEGKTKEELAEIADKKRATFDAHSDEWKAAYSQLMHDKSAGENNPMFQKPVTDFMTDEEIATWKENLSKCMLGMLYWNNGKENKRAKECPGKGWVKGRINFNQKAKRLTESIEQ